MSVPAGKPAHDEIARVAHAIWEAEGQPEGRDHDHWMRARQLVEDGRAEIEYPQAVSASAEAGGAPRPVQPAVEDDPGGRFAKQPAKLPELGESSGEEVATPGPRNPDPEPPTNPDGYVAVPSREDVAASALTDDPRPVAKR